MSKVFEDKFRQKLIALIADNGYNLGTTFEWNNVADLKGQKLAGAGLNLKWLEFAGAVPVQASLPEAYTAHADRRLQRLDHVPVRLASTSSSTKSGKYYTEIGFGAITWHGLTINTARWAKLPKEVQDIILEVAKEYEAKTGTVNEENYPKQIDELKAKGADRPQAAGHRSRQDWAKSLDELAGGDGQGTRRARACRRPRCWRLTLEAAEKHGHKWPVRYSDQVATVVHTCCRQRTGRLGVAAGRGTASRGHCALFNRMTRPAASYMLLAIAAVITFC